MIALHFVLAAPIMRTAGFFFVQWCQKMNKQISCIWFLQCYQCVHSDCTVVHKYLNILEHGYFYNIAIYRHIYLQICVTLFKYFSNIYVHKYNCHLTIGLIQWASYVILVGSSAISP